MEKENIQITSSRKFVIRDINTLSSPISRIKTLRDDEERKGFTLVELLVVVLIIGILAAIALPQYQLAVAKSRYAQVQVIGDALIKSFELYKLETSDLEPTTFEGFINLPGTLSTDKKKFSTDEWLCSKNMSYKQFICTPQKYDSPQWLYDWTTKEKRCVARSEEKKKICLAAGGKKDTDQPGYGSYILP